MIPKTPAVLGILCVVVLVASIIGINFSDDFSSFMEKSPAKYQIIADSNALSEINKNASEHKENQNQQELDLQMKLMKERQEDIASTVFGYDVTAIVDEYNFPHVDTVEIREGEKPFDICAIPEKIPIHLEKISQSKIFELFAKKYSNHHIEVTVQDERRDMSNIHYQFTALSSENEDLTATLLYHLDSCTDENNTPISLNCFDHKNKQNSHSRFADNLINSLNDDGNFCMITFEDWQQDLLEYNDELSKRAQTVHEKIMHTMTDENFDEKIILPLFEESDKVQLLQRITSHASYNLDTSEYFEENIAEYQSKYGELPDDLQLLMNARPLSAESNKEEKYSQTLFEINQLGLEYKKNNDSEKFNKQMLLMQEKQKEIASDILGVKISNVYIDKDWNFPFRNASDIEPFPNEEYTFPICDIPKNTPIHLEKIRNSDMFSMFSEKYSQNHLEFEISDERNYNSIIHYSIRAISEDQKRTAGVFFHVDSCTGKISVPYNLDCRDNISLQDEGIRNQLQTRFIDEIQSSLISEEFCVIEFEPWHQKMREYHVDIGEQLKQTFIGFEESGRNEDIDQEDAFRLHLESQRLGLLNDLLRSATSGTIEDEDTHELIAEYLEKYDVLPDELVLLLEMKEQHFSSLLSK